MFSIEDNNITLTRGDTLLLQIKLTKQGEPYVPEEGDSIRFAMKRKYTDSDSEVILVKNIPMDTLILELEPEDTKNLPMQSRYVYDLQFTDAAGRVNTFAQGTLLVTKEVL